MKEEKGCLLVYKKKFIKLSVCINLCAEKFVCLNVKTSWHTFKLLILLDNFKIKSHVRCIELKRGKNVLIFINKLNVRREF